MVLQELIYHFSMLYKSEIRAIKEELESFKEMVKHMPTQTMINHSEIFQNWLKYIVCIEN